MLFFAQRTNLRGLSMFKEIVTSLVMLPPEHLVMVGGIAAMALAGFAIYAILKIVSLSKEKR